MRGLGFAMIALLLATFMLGASLERKKIDTPWGTTAPCLEAIEDIAAEVNERLGNE